MIDESTGFVVIGERTNVTGSARFRRLVEAGDFQGALAVALEQVRGGANILDVNMDADLLDSEQAMTTFLNLIAAEPEVARLPIMVDSSRWPVIEAGLRCLQGKSVVNSLSLKEGEEEFLARARQARGFGAAVVVMAFDEQGQAETTERKVAICERAYRLLVERAGFRPEDIVFDPNVLAVGTGIEEHNGFAKAFLDAIPLIKERCPGAKISGGISNLSFAFRGNDAVREAMHAIFLYHAIRAGLDMGIVNAGQLAVYEDVEPELRERIEDVLFDRRPDATDRLLELARRVKGEGTKRIDRPELARGAGREAARVRARARSGRVRGGGRRGGAAGARRAAGGDRGPADGRHEGRGRSLRRGEDVPAPGGEERAGDAAGGRLPGALLRGAGRAARRRAARGKIVLATVAGDVHDIGKNIVAVVLGCNSYETIDLGVMVPASRIVEAAIEEGADIVGLSGLITPSLDEMVKVAAELERRGLRAAAPDRRRDDLEAAHRGQDRARLQRPDRARSRRLARRRRRRLAARPGRRDELARENAEEQERLRELYHEKRRPLLALEEARARRPTAFR